jgi:hypothetical protein
MGPVYLVISLLLATLQKLILLANGKTGRKTPFFISPFQIKGVERISLHMNQPVFARNSIHQQSQNLMLPAEVGSNT